MYTSSLAWIGTFNFAVNVVWRPLLKRPLLTGVWFESSTLPYCVETITDALSKRIEA